MCIWWCNNNRFNLRCICLFNYFIICPVSIENFRCRRGDPMWSPVFGICPPVLEIWAFNFLYLVGRPRGVAPTNIANRYFVLLYYLFCIMSFNYFIICPVSIENLRCRRGDPMWSPVFRIWPPVSEIWAFNFYIWSGDHAGSPLRISQKCVHMVMK